MNDKEIKLEIAKAAIVSGSSVERMQQVFDWVTDGKKPDVDLDGISVTDMEQYLGMSSVRFGNRCRENDIHTVGQLVRVGSKQFRSLKLVGGDLCHKVSAILKDKYGVEDW